MEINRLLGINESLVETFTAVESGIVIDDLGTGIRTGTPCLILTTGADKDGGEIRSLGNKAALFIGPHCPGAPPRHIFDINPGCGGPIIKSQGPSNILDEFSSIEIKKIDLKKINKLIENVQTKGPVSLIVTENKEECLAKDIATLCKEFNKKFKFISVMSHHKRGKRNLVPNDKVVCALTFSDIKNSLPVFSPEKSNGISMHLAILYTEQSNKNKQLVTALETTVIFSSFKENFTIIKGQKTGISLVPITALLNSILGDSTYLEVGKTQSKSKQDIKQEVREKKKRKKLKVKQSSPFDNERPFDPVENPFDNKDPFEMVELDYSDSIAVREVPTTVRATMRTVPTGTVYGKYTSLNDSDDF